MIDSQIDDMIREKLALKEQIDSLEQNLSKQIKEKESLFKTFTVFKNESKEKENKYMENEIDLEKKIKELDNIVYKEAQWMKPTLYDGVVLSNTHVAMPVIDDEETLILEEESRSKMSEKAKDPEVIAKKISHKPINYKNLNSLIDDFEKRFSPQQELSAEQAFWFRIVNPTIEPSYAQPIIVDVPSELRKVSLVNASLKKLKFYLTQFDSVVRKRTAPSAFEEEYFEINDLKARLQDKDTTIYKLKDTIKSLRENTKEEKVNSDKCELEPINKELENSVANLLSENERLCNEINHVKQVFKDQFDSIKRTHVCHKEQSDSLINKLNLKSVENEDLKAQIQDKVFVITSLKNDLRKLKGKEIVENVVHIPSATTIAQGMFKIAQGIYVPKCVTPSVKKVVVQNAMNNVRKLGLAEPLTSFNQDSTEKNSVDTEVLLEEEETPTELIEDLGSGEKGEKEISTANVLVKTAGAKVSTASHDISTAAAALVYIMRNASKAKDRGKAIMQEPEPLKKLKKRVQVQMSVHEELVRKVQDEEQAKTMAEQEQERINFKAALDLQKQ
ncbi:hypothetical protein Tco_0696319 [Tanacetum coccineum]